MKIIIDIDEEIWRHFKYDYEDDLIGRCTNDAILDAFYKGVPLPKCKECKHFEYDSVAKVDGIPLIVAHEICNKWGNGCKTREDGYCFLFEEVT